MDTSADQSTSVVLEEEIDRDYEPTEQEVIEYAEWLGMDMEEDRDLLWVAKTGLKAPLPAPWKPCTTGEDGEVFYFNFETGESVWDHPCDEYHRKLYQRERAKKHGLPYNDEEVEKAGRSLGLISAKDDAGDSLDNSAGLGGSLSASSSLAGDSKKKKKKDKKEKKSKKEKREELQELPKLEAPKSLAPLSARGAKIGAPEPTTAQEDEPVPHLSRTSSRAPSLSGKSALSDEEQDEIEEQIECNIEENFEADETLLSAASMQSPTGPPAPGMMPPPPTKTLGITGAASPPAPGSAAAPPPPAEEPPAVKAAGTTESARHEREIEEENAKLEEAHKKNVESLKADLKAKLAKHRKDLQDEFELERDKAFGDLQTKHEKQIREEKSRLVQELASSRGIMKEEIEGLAKSEEELKSQLAKKEAEIARLKSEEASSSRKGLEALDTIAKLTQEKIEAQKQVADVQAKHACETKELQAQLSAKSDEVERFRADSAERLKHSAGDEESKKELSRLQAEFDAKTQQCEAKEQLCEELNQSLRDVELNHSNGEDEAAETLFKLQADLKAKSKQCQELESSLKDCSSELDRVKEEAKMQGELQTELQGKLSKLQAEHEAKTRHCEDGDGQTIAELSKLRAELQDKTQQCEELNRAAKGQTSVEELQHVKAQLEDQTKKADDVSSKLAGLQAALQAEHEGRDRLQGKLAEAGGQLSELKRELQSRSAECTALRQTAASSSDLANEELKQLRSLLEEERRSSSKSAADAAGSAREIAVLKSQLDAGAAECQRLRARSADETTSRDDELQRLKLQINEERSATSDAKAESVAVGRELAVLKVELDGRVKEHERLQARTSEESKLALEEQRRLQSQISDERSLTTQAQSQLASLQRELALSKGELEAREAECCRLQERVAGSEVGQDEQRRRQASLEQERLAASQAASQAAREIASLKADLEARSAECNRLQNELTSATTASASMVTLDEVKRLQGQLEEERSHTARLKAEATQANRESSGLRAELESWRGEVSRLKADSSTDELRRLQSLVEEERVATSRARAEASDLASRADAKAAAASAELEARSAECGRLRAELTSARSGGIGGNVLSDSEVRELVALRSQVLDQRAEVEMLRAQIDKPRASGYSEEERSLRALVKDRDDTILRLRADAAQCTAAHSRELEELRTKVSEARQEERLRRTDAEGAVIADLKAQLRTKAFDMEQLHSEIRTSASELERLRAEMRNAEVRSSTREAAAVEAAKAAVADHWKQEVQRLEKDLQARGLDANAAREQADRASREARRFEQEEGKGAKRLEALEHEAEQAQQMAQHAREEVSDAERRLEEVRTSLRAERAARAQAEAKVRESHRELRVLKGHLQEQVGEADLVTNEARKVRHELADRDMEMARLQEQVLILESELRQLRAQGCNTQLVLQRRAAEVAERERRVDEKERFLEAEDFEERRRDDDVDAGHLGYTGLKTAVELSALSPSLGVHPVEEPEEMTLAPGAGISASEHPAKGVARVPAAAAKEDPGEDAGDALPGMDAADDAAELAGKVAGASSSPRSVGLPGFGDAAYEPIERDIPGGGAMEAACEARKKELRRERAALEELRQQFKADSQRMRASGSAAFGQALLKEVKTALDERASALNRAIDDFRAMQGGSRVRGGRGSSTARGDTGGASTPTPRSAGVGAVPAEEADVIRRWQHLLGPGSLAGAASTTPVPRSARGLRQSSRDSHERIRSNSPVSSRRSRATREAVDQHLHWLYNFSRDNVSSRPASARGSRAFGGRLGRGYY